METSLGNPIAVHSEEHCFSLVSPEQLWSWGPGSPSSPRPRLIPGEEKLICWVDVIGLWASELRGAKTIRF